MEALPFRPQATEKAGALHGASAFSVQLALMTQRRKIGDMLREPRTVSSIAHELGLNRDEVEDHIKHLVRTARTQKRAVHVEPARCRSCGFRFSSDKISKPSKCPECGGTRLYEPLIQIK
jgi:predicted Zn-ribbon and HTH transcriptional regulator